MSAARRGHPRTGRIVGAALAAILIAWLTGCAPSARPAPDEAEAARPEVVVTTNILGDVVTQVLGDAANVTTLMRPNADPHSFEISASEAAQLDRAALVVSNGLGLEEGLQHHLDRARDAGTAVFVAGDHIAALPYSADEHAGTALDPHFWTDPTRMIDVVAALTAAVAGVPAGPSGSGSAAEISGTGEPAAGLPEFSESDRAAIVARGSAYIAQLAQLDEEIATQFAALGSERRTLVTNHHVFGYLADRYDFRILGTAVPGGTTLAAPSAADLSELVGAITSAKVPAIFAESSAPDRLMRVLAEEAGVEVVVVELFTESLSLPGEGAETYLEMLTTNADRITAGLGAT